MIIINFQYNINIMSTSIFNELSDNLSDQEQILIKNYIDNKLKVLYPDIDINLIDNELLDNIIFNIINEDKQKITNIKNNMVENINNLTSNQNIVKEIENKKETNPTYNLNKEILQQNILMADEIIPEMSIPSNLIYLKGKLNGYKTKIMIDTGASSCVVFKSVVDKCGLEYLIDKSTSVMVQGAHGMKPTLGTIWFVEIELEIEKDKFVSIPISVEVIDDQETIKANEIIKEHNDKINELMGIGIGNSNSNTSKNKDNETSHNFEIILGMTFLKSYRANIDFSSMTITLNKNIKIKYN